MHKFPSSLLLAVKGRANCSVPPDTWGAARDARGQGRGRGGGKLVPANDFTFSIPACWFGFFFFPFPPWGTHLCSCRSLPYIELSAGMRSVRGGFLQMGFLSSENSLCSLQEMPTGGSTKKKIEEKVFSETFLKIASVCTKNTNVQN